MTINLLKSRLVIDEMSIKLNYKPKIYQYMDYENYESRLLRLAEINIMEAPQEHHLKEKQELEYFFQNVNNEKRNEMKSSVKLDNFLTCKNKFKNFLECTEANHALITAPTQVGKTNSIKGLVKKCLRRGIPVILSSDNKTDQQLQMYTRLTTELGQEKINFIMYENRSKFSKKFNQCVKEGETPIVFCLDNYSQIQNVSEVTFRKFLNFYEKIVIIHDEGDVVTRNDSGYENTEEASASHRSWVEYINDLEKVGTAVKRVFVTATPLNCLSHYEIMPEFIINLTPPESYVSYRDIQFVNQDTDRLVLYDNFVNRNRENDEYAACLLVMNRRVNAHLDLLESFSESLDYPDVFIHTYNSKGIHFEKYLPLEGKYDFALNEQTGYYTIKNCPISELYSIVKANGYRTVFTIGMDMISRGISFVGKDFDDPITATMMVYEPSGTLHNVALNQTIGRLTGTASPDLDRTLVCTPEVYHEYVSYNRNIEYTFQNLEEYSMLPIENRRALDRPVVKLQNHYGFRTPETDEDYTDEESIDGVKLRLLRKWCKEVNETVMSRVIYYMLDCDEYTCTVSKIKEDLEINDNNLASMRGLRSLNGKIICINDSVVTLNHRLVDSILESLDN